MAQVVMAFSNPTWKLTVGQRYDAELKIDNLWRQTSHGDDRMPRRSPSSMSATDPVWEFNSITFGRGHVLNGHDGPKPFVFNLKILSGV